MSASMPRNPGADDGAADLDSGHGTHVAGSALGSGAVDAAFSGVAPQASVVFQAIEQFLDVTGTDRDGYYLLGIPDDLNSLFQQAYDESARIHTNSWGGGRTPGEYDDFSEDVDTFVWEHPDMLILFAAGNAGRDADGDSVVDPDSVFPPGTCKNCLTVGASENDRPALPNTWWPLGYGAVIAADLTADAASGMAAFSSRGPTSDSRFKPDLVAPGTMIASARTQAAPNAVWFTDDMEGGIGGWTGGGAWAQVNTDAHTATTSWHDSPAGNYAAGVNVSLTSPVQNLSGGGLGGKALQFWCRYDLGDGDQWFLEVTSNGGITWGGIPPFSGTQPGWELFSISLGAFSDAANFQLRFRLESDADASTGDGLYVDDVRIVEGAFGNGLLSDFGLAPVASAADQGYQLMGGTSMATPLTAGAAALVRQYYTQEVGLGYVSAALLRATLINGAVDMSPGQYGLGATREIGEKPNDVEGWGRLDVNRSLFPALPAVLDWVDELAGLEPPVAGVADSHTYTLVITDDSVPIVVTMVYHDYPGVTAAVQVNELDLTIMTPAGAVLYPNGLAGPDPDNNVEQIVIPAADVVTGSYTITVTAPNVPEGPQPYALVTSAGGTFADRGPVDVMLALDYSGSMSSAACPGCADKHEVLKDAVEIFVQLWTALAVPDDRLGVTYFRTDVDELEIGGDVLLPVIARAPDIIADVRFQKPRNQTAMGGGLQAAIERLADAARPRSIILLTDGMQNVDPRVRRIDDSPPPDAFHLEIETVPPTRLDAALGRKVSTIAIGTSDPWVALLEEIAEETGGVTKATSAPDDELRRFYVEELVDVLRGFSPQLIDYRHDSLAGDSGSETFEVNRSAKQLVLKLSWHRGDQLDFRVKKGGADLTDLGKVIDGKFYKIFSIDLPARLRRRLIEAEGDWTMEISGTEDAPYEAAAIADEALLEVDSSAGTGDHRVGGSIPLRVRVSVDSSPVTDAEVSATAYRPGSGIGTLLSKARTPSFDSLQAEHKATGGQKKLQMLLQDRKFYRRLEPTPLPIVLASNGDGSYSASFDQTTVPGSYRVVFEVEGEQAEVGEFRRTETLSALVEFGTADYSASDAWLSWPAKPTDNDPIALTIRPRDRAGNYLGPDYGHRIQVTVSPGATGRPQDLLDGRYRIPLSVYGPDPEIEIAVMDRPCYQGPLSEIRPRFALSWHVGQTQPLGNFGNLVNDDQLFEVDFEKPLSSRRSLIGVLGLYRFDPGFDILGGTLYLRRYWPRLNGTRLFGEVGAGLYDPQNLDLAVGVSAGLGTDRPLNVQWRGEIGVDAFHLFNQGDDIDFLAVKIGLRRRF